VLGIKTHNKTRQLAHINVCRTQLKLRRCALDAIDALEKASDQEILENAIQLLEWMQDCNWPVFPGVVNRLSSLGGELERDICQILKGSDAILKENIIGHLIPKFEVKYQVLYSEQLKELLKSPTNADFEEGVVDFIEMQLSNVEPNT